MVPDRRRYASVDGACEGDRLSVSAENPNIEKSDNVKGLGVAFPGETVVSVKYLPDDPILRSCASAYVSNKTRGGANWSATIRVNLFAELQSIQSLIGSAFVPPGAGGLVISASGFVADSWHIKIQAPTAQIEVAAALACCTGCAEPSVRVPRGFQQPLLPPPPASPSLPQAFFDQPVAPFETVRGLSRVRSVAGALGNSIILLPDERVISISAQDGVGGGQITYEHPDGTVAVIDIDNNDTYRAEPGGALVGGVFTITQPIVDLTVITVR